MIIARVKPCDNGEPHHTIFLGGGREAAAYIERIASSAALRSAGSVDRPMSVQLRTYSGKRAICAGVSDSILDTAKFLR